MAITPLDITLIISSSDGNSVVIDPIQPPSIVLNATNGTFNAGITSSNTIAPIILNTGIENRAISASYASIAGIALQSSGLISSASVADSASVAISASYSTTSSFSNVAETVLTSPDSASYALTASVATFLSTTPPTASYSLNASQSLVAISSSYSLSASAATSITFPIISASHALNADNSNNSISSSFATTASFASSIIAPVSVSFATTSSAATSITFPIVSASHAVKADSSNTSTSASYAITASFASNVTTPVSVSFSTTSSAATSITFPIVSASHALKADSANTSTSASYALTASFASNVTTPVSVSFSTTSSAATSITFPIVSASHALNSDSANSATSSSFATTASFASNVTTPVSVSFATTASAATSITFPIVSASHALNSDTANSATSASFATTSSAATSITFPIVSASHALNSDTANTSISASFAPLNSASGDLRYVMLTGSSAITGSLQNLGPVTASQIRLSTTFPIQPTAGGYNPVGQNATSQITPIEIFYSSSGTVPERMFEVYNAGISTSNFQFNGFGFGLGRGGLWSLGKAAFYILDATGSLQTVYQISRSTTTNTIELVNTNIQLVHTSVKIGLVGSNNSAGTSNLLWWDTTDTLNVGPFFNGSGASTTGTRFYIDGPSGSHKWNAFNIELMRLSGSGQLGLGTTSPRGTLHINADSPSSSVLIVQGDPGQTADLTQWQTSSFGVVARVKADGGISASYFVGDGSQLTNIIASGSIASASFATTATSASYALTASFAANAATPVSVSFATTSSAATSITFPIVSASHALNSDTANSATSASYALTASFAANASAPVSVSFATTASAATSITFPIISASYALTASVALNASAPISTSYAITSSYASIAQNVLGSITSASYALSASTVINNPDSTPGIFNVLQYGLIGDGVTDESTALVALTSLISSSGGTIYFPPSHSYFLKRDTTIPQTVDLWIPNAATLLLMSGTTFTQRGNFVNTGPYQIFKFDKTTDGHAVVRLSPNGDTGTNHRESRITKLYTEWWGAKGDNITDDWFAIQACVDCALGYPFLPYTYTRNYVVSNVAPDGKTITLSGSLSWPVNVFTGDTFKDLTSGITSTISGSTSASVILNTSSSVNVGDNININLASSTPRWTDAPIELLAALYKHSNPIQLVNVLGPTINGQGEQVTELVSGFATNIVANNGDTGSLTVATTTWTNNQFVYLGNTWVICTSGSNKGQAKRILANTSSSLNFISAFTNPVESGSTFTILPEAGLDLNGVFQGSFSNFTVSPANTITGIYYRRDSGESARGSSQLHAEYVEVAGTSLYGWAFGGLDYFDEFQEDNTHLLACKASGGTSIGYTGVYWEAGCQYGTGFFSNNLNHTSVELDVIGYAKNVIIFDTNVSIVGTELAESSNSDITIINGLQGYSSAKEIRSEGSPHFLIYNFNPYGVFWSFDIQNLEYAANNMVVDGLTSASSFIQWAGMGDINIQNMRVGAVPFSYITASGGTTSSLTANVSWSINQFQYYFADILSGPNSGYSGQVIASDNTSLTLSPTMSLNPISGTTTFKLYQIPTVYASNYGSINARNTGITLGKIEQSYHPQFSVAHLEDFYELDESDVVIGRWKNVYLYPEFFYRAPGGIRFANYGDVPSAGIDYMGASNNVGITSMETPSLHVRDLGMPNVPIAQAHFSITGSTTYNYKLVARDANGSCSLASPMVSIINCPATLSLATSNYVALYPPAPQGGAWLPVATYDILKDFGNGTFGYIALGVPVERMNFFLDVGQPIQSYSFAASGSTGQLKVDSSASFGGSVSIFGNLNATSSNALNSISSSVAQTASLLLGTVVSSSYAGTASILLGSIVSASYALSSSYALNAATASFSLNAVGNVNASQVQPGTYPSGTFLYTGSLGVSGSTNIVGILTVNAGGGGATAINSTKGGIQVPGMYVGQYSNALGIAASSFIGWTHFGDNVANTSASIITDDTTAAASGYIRIIPQTTGPIPNGFRIFSTGKSIVNAERGFIGYYSSSDALIIGTEIIGTGSLRPINFTMTGSVVATVQTDGGISASYFVGNVPTSSYAVVAQNVLGSITSASYAGTASILLGSVQSASYALTASAATSITFPIISSSYSNNSTTLNGFASGNFTGSFTGSLLGSASYALTASFAANATTPVSVSFATTSSAATSITFPIISASHALNSDTANSATSASFATTASAATSITFPIVSSSYAVTSSYSSTSPRIAHVIPLFTQYSQRILLQNLGSNVIEIDAGMRIKADLTNASQARVVYYVAATGSNSSFIGTQYSSDQTNWHYLDGLSGTTGSFTALGVNSSTWVNITGSAIQDIFIRVIVGSGSGTENPSLGSISLQVK